MLPDSPFSKYFLVNYSQHVDPICALMSVTLAVHSTCKQYDIVLDPEVLQKELENCAIKKYRDMGEDIDAHTSDSENDENALGIGRGFRPQDFNNAYIKRMKNKTNGDLCFFKVMVEKVGDHQDQTSKKNYSPENKHVLIEF